MLCELLPEPWLVQSNATMTVDSNKESLREGSEKATERLCLSLLTNILICENFCVKFWTLKYLKNDKQLISEQILEME